MSHKEKEIRTKGDKVEQEESFINSEMYSGFALGADNFRANRLKRSSLRCKVKGLILQNPEPKDLGKLRLL